MKTIIRRASHEHYRYRTTDSDGQQDLWVFKPTYHDAVGWWCGKPSCWKFYGVVRPPKDAAKTLVRIGKVAK